MYGSDSSSDFEGFPKEEIKQHPLFEGESTVDFDRDIEWVTHGVT